MPYSFFGYTPKCTPGRAKYPVSHVRFCKVLTLAFISSKVLHLAGRRGGLAIENDWAGGLMGECPRVLACPLPLGHRNLTVLPCPNLAVRPYGNLSVLLINVDTFSSGRPKLRTLVRTPYARVLVSKLCACISPAYCSENFAPFLGLKKLLSPGCGDPARTRIQPALS